MVANICRDLFFTAEPGLWPTRRCTSLLLRTAHACQTATDRQTDRRKSDVNSVAFTALQSLYII